MKPAPFVATAVQACAISGTILPLHRRSHDNPAPLKQILNGAVFEVELQIDGQSFYMIPDTGSSDLWVPVSDFQCVNHTDWQEIPQEGCEFGSTFKVPDSMEYARNETFGVKYGTGIALGKVGFAKVSINNISVAYQKIGLVDRTDEHGGGVGSGVLGLGFPPLTSAHPGTELDNTTLLMNRAVYDPVFVNMYKQGLVEPWYSFAIERPPRNATSGPGGWLGLGELPPVSHSDNWAVKPIEVTEGLPDELTEGKRQVSLMTLTVDGVTWGSRSTPKTSYSTNATGFQAVVDTGNHMNLFPKTVADAINAAFDPPAVPSDEEHIYVVDCDATTPALGVTLDGQTFWHASPEDLIFHDVSGFCYSSVAPTAEEGGLVLNFLGDAFLRNVVSVYDFGNMEMRFAARTEVGSGDGRDDVPVSAAASASGVSGQYGLMFLIVLADLVLRVVM